MMIKRREWLSKSAQEAILFIGDERFECAAFSQPCNVGVGDNLAEPLLAINVKRVIKEDNNSQINISRQGESFAHDIIAKVIDSKARIVSVGPITIELDDQLPSDIDVGDMIQFSCGRLDVIA